MKSLSRVVAALLIGGISACADARNDEQEAGTDTAAAAPANAPAQTTSGPSDAEIMHIVKTANDADIEGGNMAKTKGQNAEVKAFGGLMISDHTALNTQGDSLAQRANLTPASNPTSQQLMSEHQAAAQKLQALNGAEFDKAYIAHEVDMHQKLLDNLDRTLIPAAQNADLKNALTQARAKVEAHLNRAKDIQGTLSR
jgi:putative membrane protein